MFVVYSNSFFPAYELNHYWTIQCVGEINRSETKIIENCEPWKPV